MNSIIFLIISCRFLLNEQPALGCTILINSKHRVIVFLKAIEVQLSCAFVRCCLTPTSHPESCLCNAFCKQLFYLWSLSPPSQLQSLSPWNFYESGPWNLLHITLIRFDQKEVKAINITFFMCNIYLLHLLCCVQPWQVSPREKKLCGTKVHGTMAATS